MTAATQGTVRQANLPCRGRLHQAGSSNAVAQRSLAINRHKALCRTPNGRTLTAAKAEVRPVFGAIARGLHIHDFP